MTLATDLGQRGVPTLIVEERLNSTDNPRCNTTNARSMEYFRRLGIADRIRRAGLPLEHPTDVVYCTSLTGWELARFRFSSSSEILSGTAPEFNDWPTAEPQHRISQIFLEPILEEHLQGIPQVTMLRGWRVESSEQSEEGMALTLRNTSTGQARQIRAAHVVGCDGGSSTMRRSIGVELQGDAEAGERRISVYFRSNELGTLLGERPGWMYWWYGDRLRGSLLRLDGTSLYLCHARVPNGTDPEAVRPDEVLIAAVGRPVAHEKLQVVRWTARRLVADRFRVGRVLLAGDAAHLWLPLGGFGMNTGIADAMGLSWRLAALHQGWGGDRLLDDYELERGAVGEATSRAALKIDKDMFSVARDPALRDDTATGERLRSEAGALIERVDRKQWYSQGVQFGSRYVGSQGVNEAPSTPASSEVMGEIDGYVPSVDPGARLPHFWRADGASLFDEIGPFYTLLRCGPDAPSSDGFKEAAHRQGIPFEVLDVSEPLAAHTYAQPLILVRPDQHIAWSGSDEPADPDTLLLSLLALSQGKEKRPTTHADVRCTSSRVRGETEA